METKRVDVPSSQIDTRGHSKSKRAKEYSFLVSTFEEMVHIHCLMPTDCVYCSEYLTWVMDGDNFTVTTECAYPEGVVYSVDLSVPSGKIVFSDSLRQFFEDPDDMTKDYIDYNSAVGRKTYSLLMAQQGVAYGAVLNTSPSVYLNTEDNSLIVANLEINEEDDSEVLPDKWKYLGYIITDLWAYSITDYSRFVNQGGDPLSTDVSVAEVPAGVYTFTHYADQANFDADTMDLTIFAKATYKPFV